MYFFRDPKLLDEPQDFRLQTSDFKPNRDILNLLKDDWDEEFSITTLF